MNRLFDYSSPLTPASVIPQAGLRVLVPFQSKEKIGIIVDVSSETNIERKKLKVILKILDQQPLFKSTDQQLLQWLCRYYHYPIGRVFCNSLPTLLKQGKPACLTSHTHHALTPKGEKLSKIERHKVLNEAPLVLNDSQQQAVDRIAEDFNQFSVFLLAGVTGSGKTEVYIQLIHKILIRGQQAMVLLPEINLTPQLEQHFKQRFSVPIVLYHSKLTPKQRLKAWLIMQQGKGFILLGTRSALLIPVKYLGLLIIDEEHDSSFKQQETLRFSTRDVAVMKAKLFKIPIVLGSATPSLESLANVEKKRYHSLQLSQRVADIQLPTIAILDVRNKHMQQGLSAVLLTHITETLNQNQQVLIFLNRRGFAPRLMCYHCGWVAQCQYCEANLVIHQQHHQLRCHHCLQRIKLIKQCPDCQQTELKPLGLGTERIEQTLKRLYPHKIIVRLDAETTRKSGSLKRYLTQINRGEVDIILGTQMIAKGHHFPEVTLAVLLDIDSGLFSLDFRASEKLAQLVIQVAGRAGRGAKAGHVILQTRQPEHPLLHSLVQHNYAQFAQDALAERKLAHLPPYSYHALLRVHALEESLPIKFFEALKLPIDLKKHQHILILGPVPAPMKKRNGRYQFQLLFQADHRPCLHAFLNHLIAKISQLNTIKTVRWSLDVDPIDLY